MSDRKKQIIDAALEIFLEKGFANVSTRDVTKHAGLSNSHLYHYFGDWSELRRTAFLKFADLQLEAVTAIAAAGPARTALRNLLTECLPRTADQAWTLWFDVWDEAMHDAALAEVYRGVNKKWHDMFTMLILRGVASAEFTCADPERAARQIFSLTMGYADELLLQPSKKAAGAALNEVLEVAALLLGSD